MKRPHSCVGKGCLSRHDTGGIHRNASTIQAPAPRTGATRHWRLLVVTSLKQPEALERLPNNGVNMRPCRFKRHQHLPVCGWCLAKCQALNRQCGGKGKCLIKIWRALLTGTRNGRHATKAPLARSSTTRLVTGSRPLCLSPPLAIGKIEAKQARGVLLGAGPCWAPGKQGSSL